MMRLGVDDFLRNPGELQWKAGVGVIYFSLNKVILYKKVVIHTLHDEKMSKASSPEVD